MTRPISSWRHRLGCLLAALLVTFPLLPGAATAESLAGSQGTDTSLPQTDSAVTVSGRPCPNDRQRCGWFEDLKFTVNQTKGLVNQAVSVTWTGARPPVKENELEPDAQDELYGNFLQIFQCWGDDDGTNPSNPGPPPENCQFGGFHSNPKSFQQLRLRGQFVYTRIVSYDGGGTNFGWKPFNAVDGTVIEESADLTVDPSAGGAYWVNPYFNSFTTNEDVVARSYPNGTGSELLTVATGLEAPGLGCGQKLEPLPDGSKRAPKCWLVIVPRSIGAAENPPGQQSGLDPVTYSPLAPASWQNRISVPLEFKPLESSCAIGADERRIAGSELAGPAVASWQPALCATPGSPPFSYTSLSDDRARQQLATAAPGAPGMAALSRPIEPTSLDAEKPAVYAPLSLSGVTIGFNIERVAARDASGIALKDPAEKPLAGTRVARLNLTPRLVAKLLAQSYQDQFGGFRPPYEWYKNNTKNLLADPDFVQFNPEFENLAQGSVGGPGRLVVELPSSDAAYEVWRWVLADPEASAWLAGAKDPWGMQVNPVYSTNPALNPSNAAFGDPVPNFFPKSDPFCYQDETRLADAPTMLPRPLCGIDIAPYVSSMQDAAVATRAARDGAVTDKNFRATSPDNAWKPEPPQPPGRRVMLSITDTASAARYGLQTAKLSRAGDNSSSRTFIAPDQASLLAGQQAMVESVVPGVLKPDPLQTKVAGAYPLTMLAYGAVLPASLDAASRKDYAAFLDYAAGPGQVQGLDLGQLPPGYSPLPADLRTQTKAAATTLRAGPAAPPAPTPTGGNLGPSGTPTPPSELGSSASPETPTTAEATPAPGPATIEGGPASGLPLLPPAAQAVLATVPTPKELAGFVRFALPIAVGLALLALLGVMIVDDRWLRALASRAHGPPPDNLPVDTG